MNNLRIKSIIALLLSFNVWCQFLVSNKSFKCDIAFTDEWFYGQILWFTTLLLNHRCKILLRIFHFNPRNSNEEKFLNQEVCQYENKTKFWFSSFVKVFRVNVLDTVFPVMFIFGPINIVNQIGGKVKGGTIKVLFYQQTRT